MVEIKTISFKPPEGVNIIAGVSHFIKTVEDFYEALAASAPGMEFAIAFNEASGERLVRFDGNSKELIDLAIDLALKVGAGHFFVVLIRKAYPINVLDKLRKTDELVRVLVATGNPVEFIIAETEQGRAVLGVVDGYTPLGVEDEKAKEERHEFLRKIGYKR